MSTPNPHEQAARARKAKALADHLIAVGVSAERARKWDRTTILAAAAAAEVKPPSDTTWQMVLDRLPATDAVQTQLLATPGKVKRPWAEMDLLISRIEVLDHLMHWWCGSYRREREQCGDLDLVVIADDASLVPEPLSGRSGLVRWNRYLPAPSGRGEVQVDVWLAKDEEIGAMLTYATGPVSLNVAMRDAAKARGWTLNEKGLFDGEGRRLDDSSEAGVFAALGWPWLPPVDRDQWRKVLRDSVA